MEENRTLISTLSKEKNNIQSILSSLRSLEKIVEFPEMHLHKIKNEIKKIEMKLITNDLIEPIKEEIAIMNQQYKDQIPVWEEKSKRMFSEKLESVLLEAGFELRGDYTRLMVSVFTIELDLENLKGIIWYGNKQENVISCRLNPEDVAKKLTKAHEKIFQREYESDTFLSNLYNAWKTASAMSTSRDTTRIPISDVLKEYVYLIQPRKFYLNPSKTNFIGYERAFFSYDIYRLESRIIEGHELNLITATRSFTRKKADFLWVPTDLMGNGDYISHITFKEI